MDCDLLVVGAGAGGMTAALVAAHEGLSVILCEASDQAGGTTATSAGTLWLPGNRHGRTAGHADTLSEAARYLEALVGTDDDRARRRAFLESGDEAISYLEARTAVKFTSAGVHPDYRVLPGAALAGRAISPLPFDGRLLGRDFARIRPPIPEFMVLGGMMVGKADIQTLVNRWRSWHGLLGTFKLVLRHATDRLRHARGTRLVMGNALVARLFLSLREAGVDLRFGWRLDALVQKEGRVTGARFTSPEGERVLCARLGVVLATGGVGHHAALRRELGPSGVPFVSLACDSVRGQGLFAAREAGASLESPPHGNFLWQPASRVPRAKSNAAGGGLFPHLFLDRAKPGLIAVDRRGRRFVNEAASYHHFVEGLVTHAQATGDSHAWLVCDATFVHLWGLGIIPPGTRALNRWVARGYITLADSVDALARQVGIDAQGLVATVAQANEYATDGADPQFRKGEAPVDRFNGDAGHRPNPCLGPLLQPPFVALPIHAADAASSAGLATDRDGRVLRGDGSVMHGLYACGNDAASVMGGTYPGPGATLGPALVFGWRLARHAAHHARTALAPNKTHGDTELDVLARQAE